MLKTQTGDMIEPRISGKFVRPKEQPPRKLSGKRTVHINSGKRIILAEGANL
jgi:hypothetical protein